MISPLWYDNEYRHDHIPIIGVGPNKIAHGALVRNLLYPIQIASMIERVNRRRQTAVKAEYAIRYDCSHGQIIKGIRKMLPDVSITILSEAFVIETIDLGNLTTLVITAKNCDPVFVSHFERHQQGDSF